MDVVQSEIHHLKLEKMAVVWYQSGWKYWCPMREARKPQGSIPLFGRSIGWCGLDWRGDAPCAKPMPEMGRIACRANGNRQAGPWMGCEKRWPYDLPPHIKPER